MTTQKTDSSESNSTQANPQDNNREMLPLLYGTEAVRIIKDDQGETWWVAKDVLGILDLEHTTNALKGLDDDELTVIKLQSGGQKREMKVINESGLYTLILRSNKPAAKPFRRWVTKDVLPQIRKTGAYNVSDRATRLSQNDMDAITYMLSAVDTIQRDMARLTELRKYDDSPVAPFCDDQCSYKAGGFILKDEIYSRYESYCYIKEEYTLSKPVFFRRLYKYASFVKSVKRIIKGKTSHGITGLSLKDLSSIQLIEGGA